MLLEPERIEFLIKRSHFDKILQIAERLKLKPTHLVNMWLSLAIARCERKFSEKERKKNGK